MSTVLPSNSEKQSMNDVRQIKRGLLGSNRLGDTLASAVCWSKICTHRKSLLSLPDQISTALFINIHWIEISLQNLLPFFQKTFLGKIALKKLHVFGHCKIILCRTRQRCTPIVHFVVSEINFNHKLACGTTKRPCSSK